jgi:hypothetical protein
MLQPLENQQKSIDAPPESTVLDRFGKKHRPTSGPSTLVVPKSFPNESGIWPQKLFCPFCVTIPGDTRLRFWQK